jgi:hypothetical protein
MWLSGGDADTYYSHPTSPNYFSKKASFVCSKMILLTKTAIIIKIQGGGGERNIPPPGSVKPH